MARPRKEETTTSGAQAEGTNEQAQDEAGSEATSEGTSGLNKKELVRQALKALGKSSKPAKIHDWILKRYREDIDPNHISSYKSQLLGASKKKRKRSEAAPTTTRANSSSDVSFKDIQAVKNLADRLGQKKFWGLIDLLLPVAKAR